MGGAYANILGFILTNQIDNEVYQKHTHLRLWKPRSIISLGAPNVFYNNNKNQEKNILE